MTKAETARFGPIEVSEERVFHFPEGLPGLSGKRFLLVDDAKAPGVTWLQSLEDPAIALCLVDPKELDIEMNAQPKPAELRPILPEGETLARLTSRVVVRTGELPGEIFLNLFAPIYFDQEKRTAMQVPLVGSGFSVHEPWPPRPEELHVKLDEP
jgi:flagellar assembly factor FliW